MPVLAEATSVIVKNSSINEKFSGGRNKFLSTIPNNTYCSDNELHRIGFMSPNDVERYIDILLGGGLEFIRENKFIDIAVVDMLRGPTIDCEWLGFSRSKFFSGLDQYIHAEDEFSIVWQSSDSNSNEIPTDDKNTCNIVVPDGWNPDKAIYGSDFVSNEKFEKELVELDNDNGVKKYLFAETGKIVYIGSPKIKK
jgi:hypothetical protein